MLNEMLEFEEYTSNASAPEKMPTRLHKQNIKGSRAGEISGISRPMLIVARKYMFEDENLSFDNQILNAKEALLSWLGFSNGLPQISSWLRNYCGFLYPGFEKAVEGKSKQFGRGIFPVENKSDNDLNAIRYDHILSEAYRMGRLRRYYLVCDEEPQALMQSEIKKLSDTNSLANLRKGDLDSILKITAYYLLQRRDSDQKYIFVTMTDVCNWIGRNAQNSRKQCFSRYYLKRGEPLIDYRDMANNRSKISIKDEWINHFLIVEENGQEIASKQYYMSDGGYSKSLLDGLGVLYADVTE